VTIAIRAISRELRKLHRARDWETLESWIELCNSLFELHPHDCRDFFEMDVIGCLPSMRLSDRSKLPEHQAIYFVFLSGSLVWIGSTKSLKGRLNLGFGDTPVFHQVAKLCHSSTLTTAWTSETKALCSQILEETFVYWYFSPVCRSIIYRLEHFLIKKYQPEWNVIGTVRQNWS